MNDTKAARTRETLIQAANQVLVHDGISHLTLEAVAEAAGVSKGGLLYHFPGKEALVEGMIDHYLTRFEHRLESYLPQHGDNQPGNWLRAYIRATFDTDDEETAVSAGLLAAIGINPDLLKPMQARYAAWQARIDAEAGDNRILATVIRLALDGLWMSDLFGMAPPDSDLRAQLLSTLLNLSKDTTP
ncbi:MAG: TetR/AcrR family transcriptional regulator [Anaerolineae bacterium]|nr:TetR/AcrR family transcriptional regulator [Anaerolineae bacterium]